MCYVEYIALYLFLLFLFILASLKVRQHFTRCRTYSVEFVLGFNVAVYWNVTPCNLLLCRSEIDDRSWTVGTQIEMARSHKHETPAETILPEM